MNLEADSSSACTVAFADRPDSADSRDSTDAASHNGSGKMRSKFEAGCA